MRLRLALALLVTASTAAAQPPTDTTRKAQAVPTVTIEAKADPKPATPAEDRSRFGGRTFTPKDFERIGAQGWTDVVRMVPGVTFESQQVRRGSTLRSRRLVMKGGGGLDSTGSCVPAIFVDGTRYYSDPSSNSETDWDQIVPLELVKRIEVYSGATVPQQYKAIESGGGGGCGSILLWTHEERPADEKKSP